MQKNKTKYFSLNVHINQHQIDKEPQHKNINSKIFREKKTEFTSKIGTDKVCMNRTLITQKIRPIISKCRWRLLVCFPATQT